MRFAAFALAVLAAATGASAATEKEAYVVPEGPKPVMLVATQPLPAATERCEPVTEEGVARMFEEWNATLVSGTPADMAARYWEKGSVLLATLADAPRVTPAEKEDYFVEFMANKPSGVINERIIELGCNSATDAGIYTFTLGATDPPTKVPARYTYTYTFDPSVKQWKITTHHSSKLPSSATAAAAAPAPAPAANASAAPASV